MLPGGGEKIPSIAMKRMLCTRPSVFVVSKHESRPYDNMTSGMSQLGYVHQWAYAAFSSAPDASNRWGERQLGSLPAAIDGRTGAVSKAWCSPWVERALSNGQREGGR